MKERCKYYLHLKSFPALHSVASWSQARIQTEPYTDPAVASHKRSHNSQLYLFVQFDNWTNLFMTQKLSIVNAKDGKNMTTIAKADL